MGANKDPKAMQMAVSQLEAAKRSREERAGANERREAKPAPGGPSGGGSDDWLGDFYRDNNIGGRGGSLDNEARDYWTKEAQTRGRDAVMDTIRGTAQDQGTWGGPREPMPEKPPRDIGGRPPKKPPRQEWPNRPPEFGEQEGRPGIRPPKPPRDEPKIPGRPPGGRGDGRIQPFPYPPRGEEQFGPGRPFPGFPGRPPGEGSLPGRPPSKPFPGRPIGDDQFPVGEDPIGLFPIPGRPPKKPPFFEGPLPGPEKPMPGRPNRPIPGRRPVEEHPWGREDDPNYGRKKSIWHQKKRAAERREHEFRRALKRRRGGIDFGPGRGSRIDRDVPRPEMETGVNTATGFNTGLPGGDFINPEQATRGQEYLNFMKRLMLQKQGQFNR